MLHPLRNIQQPCNTKPPHKKFEQLLASVFFCRAILIAGARRNGRQVDKTDFNLAQKVDHTRSKSKVDHTKMKSKVDHTQMRSKVQVNEEEVSLKQPTASSGKKGGLMDIMRYPT